MIWTAAGASKFGPAVQPIMEPATDGGRWRFPRFLQIPVKVQFGEYTLDSDARRLSRRGDAVRLSPKAFDLLQLLIERRPNVLDKSAIHAKIWPDTFVVDANLTVLIAELRKALEDNAREPRFIRTVHALGYAFCGDANAIAGAAPRGRTGARCRLIGNGGAFELADGDNLIGRDPDCAVWLEASGVSRRHARIHVSGGGDALRIEDLGSTNGSSVDGSPISGTAEVVDGSVIQIGGVELTLRVLSRSALRETERISKRRR